MNDKGRLENRSQRKAELVLTRSDLAKYPFLLDAAEEVKRLDLKIESLENPELEPILERAEKRIEEALRNASPQVSYLQREESIEIPSFPVAVMLAAASANNYIKRRYALAEAKRAHELLKVEDKQKVIEIAKVFNWKIRAVGEQVGDRRYDFALFFGDFLRNTGSLREKEWKLINKLMLKGEVYLTRSELSRLLQEEIRRHIEGKLDVDVRPMLSDSILERVDNLKRKYARQIGEATFRRFPGKVVDEAYPPCVKQLYDAARSGSHIAHVGRFTLTSFLISIGMKPAEVVNLFRSSSDFNERMTRYQVEHIAGDRGSRTKYRPPRCETLKTHGLCPGPDELCRRIRSPWGYYLRKMGTLKKEVPAS